MGFGAGETARMDINLFIMAAWERKIARCTIWRSVNRKVELSERFSIFAARKGSII